MYPPGHNSCALNYQAPGIFPATYESKEAFECSIEYLGLNLLACSAVEIFTTALLLLCLFDSKQRKCL